MDGDGDADLVTGGGGNFTPAASEEYQNHLYLNDGRGSFSLKAGAFPLSHHNCGAAVPIDFNADGRMDIFFGNRGVPQQYGMPPESQLLQQQPDGTFLDVTATSAPGLQRVGMVTDARLADLDGDGQPELIIVGEWSPVRVFSWKKGRFSELGSGLESMSGWWQGIATGDLDGDGDTDLVLGNLGLNFYLQPNKEHPVKLWVHDFDANGTMDKVFTRTIGGRDMPVFMKKDMVEQIPGLKKANLRNKEYAKRSVQELFEDRMDSVIVWEVNSAASMVALNDGKGQFKMIPLPDVMQLSSIRSISLSDVNADGKPDLVTGGNFFELLPQFCRIDASYGHVAMNAGAGNFRVIPQNASGLNLPGQVRSILPLNSARGRSLLILQNRERPLLYRLNDSPSPLRVSGREPAP
jgi:hypothetical protein